CVLEFWVFLGGHHLVAGSAIEALAADPPTPDGAAGDRGRGVNPRTVRSGTAPHWLLGAEAAAGRGPDDGVHGARCGDAERDDHGRRGDRLVCNLHARRLRGAAVPLRLSGGAWRWGAGRDAFLCRSVRRALFAYSCVPAAAQGARRGRA